MPKAKHRGPPLRALGHGSDLQEGSRALIIYGNSKAPAAMSRSETHVIWVGDAKERQVTLLLLRLGLALLARLALNSSFSCLRLLRG